MIKKIVRWDNADTICEYTGTVLDAVVKCLQSGISLTRANLAGADLTRANLAGANLAGADLTRADLTRADLTGANLAGADLTGANLTGANLADARLPIWCKWRVSFTGSVVHIGCKSKTIHDWDDWFAGSDEFESPRNSDDFKLIRANYLAVRAYIVELGLDK